MTKFFSAVARLLRGRGGGTQPVAAHTRRTTEPPAVSPPASLPASPPPASLPPSKASPPSAQEPPVRQPPPAHLLEAAARFDRERAANAAGTVAAPKQERTVKPAQLTAETASAEIAVVPPSEVLVRRTPGRSLHMHLRAIDGEFIYIAWHNDSDKAINWRIASHHHADALRRVLMSTAFVGCTFSLDKKLFDQLPAEARRLVDDAITCGAVQSGTRRWLYEGTVVLLAESGQPLAIFDCAGDTKEARVQQYVALIGNAN